MSNGVLLAEYTAAPNMPTVIRVIPTSEGLAFCSTSIGGAAFVVRPGETLIFAIQSTFSSYHEASTPETYHGSATLRSSHILSISKLPAE